MYGFLDIVQFLVDRGADVRTADDDGWTPLHHAVCYGDRLALAHFLLDEGARPDVANNRGETPIDLAADPREPITDLRSVPPDVGLLFRMIGESGALIVLATKMVAAAAERQRRRTEAAAVAAAEGPCTRSRAKRPRPDGST